MNLIRKIIREELGFAFGGGYDNYPEFLDTQFNPQIGKYPPVGVHDYGTMVNEEDDGDNMIKRARNMADVAHGGQKYGNFPYMHHIDDVVKIAIDLGYSRDVIIACYLHDTIEDTSISREDIEDAFGKHIADVVYAVTDEDGANRKERKGKTYIKIKSIPDAISVKLCDRISNVRESLRGNDKLFDMYKNEHPAFEITLRDSSNKKAWNMLDSMFKR